MEFLLVIILAGADARPVFVPVGTVATEAACIDAGENVVRATLEASGVAADYLCLGEVAMGAGS